MRFSKYFAHPLVGVFQFIPAYLFYIAPIVTSLLSFGAFE